MKTEKEIRERAELELERMINADTCVYQYNDEDYYRSIYQTLLWVLEQSESRGNDNVRN